jgi:hypothetical protein
MDTANGTDLSVPDRVRSEFNVFLQKRAAVRARRAVLSEKLAQQVFREFDNYLRKRSAIRSQQSKRPLAS